MVKVRYTTTVDISGGYWIDSYDGSKYYPADSVMLSCYPQEWLDIAKHSIGMPCVFSFADLKRSPLYDPIAC